MLQIKIPGKENGKKIVIYDKFKILVIKAFSRNYLSSKFMPKVISSNWFFSQKENILGNKFLGYMH